MERVLGESYYFLDCKGHCILIILEGDGPKDGLHNAMVLLPHLEVLSANWKLFLKSPPLLGVGTGD